VWISSCLVQRDHFRIGERNDRTSCRSPRANQFRLILHTAAYWLLHTLRAAAPAASSWATAEFTTLRLRLIKIATRISEGAARIRIRLPSACPDKALFRLLAGRFAAVGPQEPGRTPPPKPLPSTSNPRQANPCPSAVDSATDQRALSIRKCWQHALPRPVVNRSGQRFRIGRPAWAGVREPGAGRILLYLSRPTISRPRPVARTGRYVEPRAFSRRRVGAEERASRPFLA
jgi:hypothetical protein